MASDEHTVKRFDHDLDQLNALVFKMGGLVEDQILRAMEALENRDVEAAHRMIARDHVVNFMDVQADEQIVNILALRQPMGRDLRMVMSLAKSVTDLERIGDEAERIGRMAVDMFENTSVAPSSRLLRDAHSMSRLAVSMLRGALDALARLDVDKAIEVARGDAVLDQEFQSALRRLATFNMEDPRNVGHTINVIFIVKSLERIGDHAKNIAEYVIFLTKGKDVRHVSPESLDEEQLNGA